MPFLMIRDDITKVRTDALVNPANEALLEGSGTSRAIYLAAGEKRLIAACREIGHCNPGKAVITKAYDLPVKFIIHAVGSEWIDGGHGEEACLYSAYRESMLLAVKYGLESIAFPLLSSGYYGYPKDVAMRTAIRAISDFLMEHELLVYLVLYDRSSVNISKKLFAAVEEYIDDHYVEQRAEQTRCDNLFNYRDFGRKHSFMPVMRSAVQDKESDAAAMADFVPAAPKRSLDALLDQMDETFSQMLLRLIDERGLKDAYVYKKANVDRRHFSKIRNDIHYAPNKKTVLAFAIALELSLDETKDLLMRAGFAFSSCSKSDVIICYFVENRKYDIFEINEMLFAYGQPVLGG